MPKRQSIYSDAFSHGNPIPAACRVGNLLMTGIINGANKGEPPGDLRDQCRLMFERVRAIMNDAGGSTDNIVKVNVAFTDVTRREEITDLWVDLFPDPANRPVRHSVQSELDRGKLIQCDIIAMMD
ncbi:MAG: RidA family protein [Beijerinckiaceae bacterium]|nr:RidA family protein [Beijerinckiaceae bacterium]